MWCQWFDVPITIPVQYSDTSILQPVGMCISNRVMELTVGSAFVWVFLFLCCLPPFILSHTLCHCLSFSFHLFTLDFCRCRLSLGAEERKRHSNEWSAKRLFFSRSLLQACNNHFCACALCLQEKEKADGNIDQCEFTYCVQNKQHFSKYAMLCSMAIFFSSAVIVACTKFS